MWKNSKFFVTLEKGQRKIKTIGLVHNFIIVANSWNPGRRSMLNVLWCPRSGPRSWFNVENYKFFVTLEKGQRKVKVKTICRVHNFIIVANSWKHDRRSTAKNFYCVTLQQSKCQGQNNYPNSPVNELWCPQSHPVHGTMWINLYKCLVTLKRVKEWSRLNNSLVHYFIILIKRFNELW